MPNLCCDGCETSVASLTPALVVYLAGTTAWCSLLQNASYWMGLAHLEQDQLTDHYLVRIKHCWPLRWTNQCKHAHLLVQCTEAIERKLMRKVELTK